MKEWRLFARVSSDDTGCHVGYRDYTDKASFFPWFYLNRCVLTFHVQVFTKFIICALKACVSRKINFGIRL